MNDCKQTSTKQKKGSRAELPFLEGTLYVPRGGRVRRTWVFHYVYQAFEISRAREPDFGEGKWNGLWQPSINIHDEVMMRYGAPIWQKSSDHDIVMSRQSDNRWQITTRDYETEYGQFYSCDRSGAWRPDTATGGKEPWRLFTDGDGFECDVSSPMPDATCDVILTPRPDLDRE